MRICRLDDLELLLNNEGKALAKRVPLVLQWVQSKAKEKANELGNDTQKNRKFLVLL